MTSETRRTSDPGASHAEDESRAVPTQLPPRPPQADDAPVDSSRPGDFEQQPPPPQRFHDASIEARLAIMERLLAEQRPNQVPSLPAYNLPSLHSGVEPKLPKISQYAGKEADLESWLSNTANICSLTKRISLNDVSCVRYARLFLTGNASSVFETRCTELRGTPGYEQTWDTAGLQNWTEFAAFMRQQLGPANPDITGRTALRRLRQTGSVAHYNKAFRDLYMTLHTPMHDLDKREVYLIGLKAKVQEYVRGHCGPDASFHECSVAAETYDKTMWAVHRGGSSSTAGGPTPMDLGAIRADIVQEVLAAVNARPTGSPQAGRMPKLTEEERARCVKEGLCFRCRKPGHSANNCPVFPKQGRKN